MSAIAEHLLYMGAREVLRLLLRFVAVCQLKSMSFEEWALSTAGGDGAGNMRKFSSDPGACGALLEQAVLALCFCRGSFVLIGAALDMSILWEKS